MDPRLLEYYNSELLYLRARVVEFARQHPKIARRLGLQAGDILDPYVERLVQAFCFIFARVRIQLDAAFPSFTGPLLEVVYPNYVAPTPSMAVARLHPDHSEGSLVKGFCVERGTAFTSRVPEGEVTPCGFRSGLSVMLWPLDQPQARITGVPPDIPGLEQFVAPGRPVKGALRLKLRTTGEVRMCDLQGLDELTFHLGGEESTASRLFELIHAAGLATVTGEPGTFSAAQRRFNVAGRDSIVPAGMEPGDSLLPAAWKKYHGHGLLHEFAACPARFWFFTLKGLAAGLRHIKGREAEIVVLLDRYPGELAARVDGRDFVLFATPVVNLFRRTTDPVEMPGTRGEFRLEADLLRPQDVEVHSINALYGQVAAESEKLGFEPLFQALNQDENSHGRYFTTRREHRLTGNSKRRYGTHTSYMATDTFVSLVDGSQSPYGEPVKYLSIDAWLTNRDLPNLLRCDGVNDLTPDISAPFRTAGLIRAPSAPRPPLAEREAAWLLIQQLNLNCLPYSDENAASGAHGLRDVLRLFNAPGDTRFARQIDSLTGLAARPVNRRLPGNDGIMFGRGIECSLTVDERGFDGHSPYLLGLILEHYLARNVPAHSFTQTVLYSQQRGRIATWPVRMGTREVA
ncbi:type VI secretion system baseplate subunit TssF [Paraburkholderia lycopersici]|nr:type VI secretion system baseplate subunit TssF [Paraburkholderia lycopersici]